MELWRKTCGLLISLLALRLFEACFWFISYLRFTIVFFFLTLIVFDMFPRRYHTLPYRYEDQKYVMKNANISRTPNTPLSVTMSTLLHTLFPDSKRSVSSWRYFMYTQRRKNTQIRCLRYLWKSNRKTSSKQIKKFEVYLPILFTIEESQVKLRGMPWKKLFFCRRRQESTKNELNTDELKHKQN